LIDKAKIKIIMEQEMDGDKPNHLLEIWEDPLNMKLLTSGSLDPNECTSVDIERAKRRVRRYHW
jgi:hypothetical protein